MNDYIILDTCIFRELGYKFFESIDYVNLFSFSIATEGEVLLSRIVIEEFVNQYKQDLQKKGDAFNTSIGALKRHPFFEFDKKLDMDISVEVERAFAKFKERVETDPKFNLRVSIVPDRPISSIKLTKFILESRNLGIANVQVRDYLIWDSLLAFAKECSEETVTKIGRKKIVMERHAVVFITKDSGYRDNPLFTNLKEQYDVNNIEILSSIPQYLHIRGYNLPFFTEELIIHKITKQRILKDLDKDINVLITYVDPMYNDGWELAQVLRRDITKIGIEEYYSYLDTKDNTYKYVVHLKVYLDILFDAPEIYDSHTNTEGWSSPRSYDKHKRPVFAAPVLFMYGGLLDVNSRSIKSVRMIDYLPWVYLHPSHRS